MLKNASLWDARRGRRVGERGYVQVWNARLPDSDLVIPHINVCTLNDDEDCEEYRSGIWAITPEGRAAAERIARDLLTFGFAWVWPHEADWVRVDLAPMHHLHEIGVVEAARP